eukprot:NODE_25867_length_573_cov_0.674888.p1 GENE.NODE_25867_length_573_cov_0.674888~~NODE_25867_length_573_cov_0.674888.p1  ORF type:complete len:142 (+),score=6.60 NODE_25867_length_573_cov_0.674888:114-539(+)
MTEDGDLFVVIDEINHTAAYAALSTLAVVVSRPPSSIARRLSSGRCHQTVNSQHHLIGCRPPSCLTLTFTWKTVHCPRHRAPVALIAGLERVRLERIRLLSRGNEVVRELHSNCDHFPPRIASSSSANLATRHHLSVLNHV